MSSQRRLVAAALALAAVIVGCWLGLLAPKRSQISAVQEQITQAESRRDSALDVVRKAELASVESPAEAAAVARLGKAVPADDDVGPLIKQLDSIADANNIDFRAVKLVAGSAPAPAAAPPASPGDAPAGGEAKTGDSGNAAGADTGAAATEPVAAVVAQPPPGAVVGPAGLLTLPFSFTFDGGYAEMQRFLKAVHGLAKSDNGQIRVKGRLMTIDGFSLAAGPDGFPSLQALVSATAYVMPAPDPAAAAAPAATAAGAPTGTAVTG